MTTNLTSSFEPQLEPLSANGIGVAYFSSITAIPRLEWQRVQPTDNLFLQRDYLEVLENHPPRGMRFAYLLFYHQLRPVGLAVLQLQHFRASESLGLDQARTEAQRTPCFFTAYGRFLKNFVANRVEFNTMVCGNLLLTGEHGWYFKPPELRGNKGQQLLVEAMHHAKREIERQGLLLSAMLVKDYYPERRPGGQMLVKRHFNEFTVQPNMVLKLRPEWRGFDDYLGAFSSKYRVRAKRAFKKGKALRKEELTLAQMRHYEGEMYQLYRSVAEHSGFNLINLNSHYLLALKEQLPDAFRCYAYFLEDKLVAFYTSIANGAEMEAHFLGFDKNLNASHQIYLNILYDLVRGAIDGQHDRLVFARTAMEIKSSVGAEAIDMYCYLRHRNSITNKLVHPLFDYLKPREDDWKPRHPFK
ncbi:MAG: GNAT family N-acetyltransferase [Bacteroidota bacterium]